MVWGLTVLPPKRLFRLPVLVFLLLLSGCGAAQQGGKLFDGGFWANTPFKTSSDDAELGIAAMASGDYLKAEALFLAALRRDPRDVHALLGAGILYQNTGQNVKAREMYEAVLAIRPPESEQFIALQDVSTIPVSQLASLNLTMLDSQGVLGGISPGGVAVGNQPVRASGA